jgi:medium-chain acyl-[acyl-carrier-protein] hydrolase
MTPFVRPRAVAKPAVRLIAFHHAAGSSSTYYGFNNWLPDDWDLLLLDLPGRGKRYTEAPISTMAEIVACAVRDVTPWFDAPIAMFGHSLGAIVAFEVGRACERLGTAPIWVGVSGRNGPTHRPKRRRLHEFDDDALLSELFALGGMSPRIAETPEFVAHFLRNARADLAAVDSYEPEPARGKSSYPMTGFAGIDDPWAPPHTMRCWAQETSGGFRLCEFAGGHFYFLGQSLSALARTVVAEVEHSGL